MPKYLLMGSYTVEGTKGVMKEGGTGRADAARRLIESVGGTLETVYFAFGENDFYVVADLPDHAAAAAISMVTGGSGAISLRTVVLITPEEMDEATRRTPDYRPPGA